MHCRWCQPKVPPTNRPNDNLFKCGYVVRLPKMFPVIRSLISLAICNYYIIRTRLLSLVFASWCNNVTYNVLDNTAHSHSTFHCTLHDAGPLKLLRPLEGLIKLSALSQTSMRNVCRIIIISKQNQTTTIPNCSTSFTTLQSCSTSTNSRSLTSRLTEVRLKDVPQ